MIKSLLKRKFNPEKKSQAKDPIAKTESTDGKGVLPLVADVGEAIGKESEDTAHTILDSHFYSHKITEVVQPHITAFEELDDLKDLPDHFAERKITKEELKDADKSTALLKEIAYHSRLLRRLYNSGSYAQNNLGPRYLGEDPNLVRAVYKIWSDADRFTGGWYTEMHEALKTLRSDSGVEYHNVLVTTSPLTRALALLMMYGYDHYFPVDNVYSSLGTTKEEILKLISSSFPGITSLIAIGGAKEEETAASRLALPFIKVESIEDIKQLSTTVQLHFREKLEEKEKIANSQYVGEANNGNSKRTAVSLPNPPTCKKLKVESKESALSSPASEELH